jgi:hypothetical protein
LQQGDFNRFGFVISNLRHDAAPICFLIAILFHAGEEVQPPRYKDAS